MLNTIIAAHVPSNCLGGIVDMGHNLSSDSSCELTSAGSMNNTDPRLGPLTNQGGPTLTLALLPGSPAIDGGDTASAPANDQRGFPRPVGAAADIGAYEFGSPAFLQVSRANPNTTDLLAIGVPDQPLVLQTSTNLATWSGTATNRFAPSGTFVFHDNAEPGWKFYRLELK